MRVLIVQYDNRNMTDQPHLISLMKRNDLYAKKHDYSYCFVTETHFDVPAYWLKVLIVKHYLLQGFDIVIWIDTDAVIHNFDMRVEDLFTGDEFFIYSSDNPLWHSPFNAGVFLVKRSMQSIQLMEDWIGLYNANLWRKENNQWVTSEAWAEDAFEQGSFVNQILPKYSKTGFLKKVDWKILQSPYPLADSFTLHFPGPYKLNIPIYENSQLV